MGERMKVKRGAGFGETRNWIVTSEIRHFPGSNVGKEGIFFLLRDNHWCPGWRRGDNLLEGLVNKGEVLLHGELWRGGHRET